MIGVPEVGDHADKVDYGSEESESYLHMYLFVFRVPMLDIPIQLFFRYTNDLFISEFCISPSTVFTAYS